MLAIKSKAIESIRHPCMGSQSPSHLFDAEIWRDGVCNQAAFHARLNIVNLLVRCYHCFQHCALFISTYISALAPRREYQRLSVISNQNWNWMGGGGLSFWRLGRLTWGCIKMYKMWLLICIHYLIKIWLFDVSPWSSHQCSLYLTYWSHGNISGIDFKILLTNLRYLDVIALDRQIPTSWIEA